MDKVNSSPEVQSQISGQNGVFQNGYGLLIVALRQVAQNVAALKHKTQGTVEPTQDKLL